MFNKFFFTLCHILRLSYFLSTVIVSTFVSQQMNKSERSHLEAIQNIEFVTCQIADTKELIDNDNENIEFVTCQIADTRNLEDNDDENADTIELIDNDENVKTSKKTIDNNEEIEFADCQSRVDKNGNCCSAFVNELLVACKSCNKCKAN